MAEFDSVTLARLTFVREALRRGLAFQDDTTADGEPMPIPTLDPRSLCWAERARLFGVEGLAPRWHSGRFRRGVPIPTEEYIELAQQTYKGWLS